jgi:hypothetical protein
MNDFFEAFKNAVVYVDFLEEKKQAFSWLEKALAESDMALPYLKVNPAFEPVRSDPRFADLLRRIGLEK